MREKNQATVAEGLARENELSKALISSGMDPAQVAKLVVEAVESNRFYVITHPDEYGPEIEARTRRMLAGEPPEPVGLEAILGSTQAAASGRKET
jgi:hypothetical protein